jgi:hypothetical protein
MAFVAEIVMDPRAGYAHQLRAARALLRVGDSVLAVFAGLNLRRAFLMSCFPGFVTLGFSDTFRRFGIFRRPLCKRLITVRGCITLLTDPALRKDLAAAADAAIALRARLAAPNAADRSRLRHQALGSASLRRPSTNLGTEGLACPRCPPAPALASVHSQ